jgi:hypothetical protein
LALPGSCRHHPVTSAIREQTGPAPGGAGIDVADPSETSGPRFNCDAQRGISYCAVVGFKLNPEDADLVAGSWWPVWEEWVSIAVMNGDK